jgi:methylmalonyl-CoA mutase N-terminal domain/subunit
VIAHETGVVNTADPLGGSYFLEHLTNEIERQAYEYFERIEQRGGVIEAIKSNFFQSEIAEASFRFQREVEERRRLIVGVNAFQQDDDSAPDIHRIDPAIEARQVDRVRAVRARRDSATVESKLARLKQDAGADRINLMPAIIDAAKADVTMGEMCDALRETWGTWREAAVF